MRQASWHSEEGGRVVFPANDNATVVLRPSKQALDFLRVQRKKEEGAHVVRALLPTSGSEPQLRAYS
jgi:uncharacterized membrane protein